MDILFKGNDGGSTITALTLDMSAAGQAFFNSNVNIGLSSTFAYGRINSNSRSSVGMNVGGSSATAIGIYMDNSDGGATMDLVGLGSSYGAHGASAGNIDEYSVFYMRSRGIDLETASKLLIYGFADEIISQIEQMEFRDFIEDKFLESLPDYKFEF